MDGDLPISYRRALQAMKDQAVAAEQVLSGNRNAIPAVKDAQQRMAQDALECWHITQLLVGSRDASLTIHTLDAARLTVELAREARAGRGVKS